METPSLNYSEAFAGSGEFAVIMLVVSVMSAEHHSLILLDEPEVSLHPGAQDRVMSFLEEQVASKKHQVVLSTHSPTIVRRLPPDAIKVLVMSPTSGRVTLANQSSAPEVAFFHLGEPSPNHVMLVVEDKLAAEIVLQALQPAGEAILAQFDIRYFPGGSDTLWGHYLPIYAAESRKNVFILFDGDQKPDVALIDPNTIPDVDHEKIAAEIVRVAGRQINFPVDGGKNGADVEQLKKVQRAFAGWAFDHVRYLPGAGNPEEFIWDNMKRSDGDDAFDDLDSKTGFEKLTRKLLNIADFRDVKSEDIYATQRQRLATISEQDGNMKSLRKTLLAMVDQLSGKA
jgi:hypothetical protein